MNKKTLSLLALLLVFTSMFSLFVEIGDGEATTTSVPLNSIWDYSWSTYILTSDQIGDAIEINQLQYNVGNTPANYEMLNQKVYFKLVTETEVPVTYPSPETSEFTLVFDGDVTWNEGGWQGIYLDTTFQYDGTSNLQLVWESHDGEYASSGPNFLKTDVTGNVAAYKVADDNYPAIDGASLTYFPNTKLGYAVADEPTPVTMLAPVNGALNVTLNSELTWEMGDNTVGVDLYLSTNMALVADMAAEAKVIDNQDVTIYTASNLEEWSTYYWKIVSRSSADYVVSSPVWSFSTILPEGTVQIGTENVVNQGMPIEPYFGYTYTQTIYNQEDINTMGAIESIAWHYNGNAAWGPDTIAVYMTQTEIDTFETTESWLAHDLLTPVYVGGLSVEAVDGWVQIMLDTPFNYDNTQNLIIAVDENTTGFHTGADEFFCSAVDSPKSITYRNDSINPDPLTPPVGTLKSYIPNIVMNFTGAVVEQFPAPSNLTAEIIEDVNVNLAWNMPILPQSEGTWLFHGTGTNSDGFGTGNAASFMGAVRFDTADLAGYDGTNLEQVKFFPRVADATYTIKVWTGGSYDGTTFNPGTEVLAQEVTEISNQEWNYVDLSTPVAIDGTQELWIAIDVTTTSGYPIGMDEGPAVAGKGDLYNFAGNWGETSTLGTLYNRNFNIEALVNNSRVMYRDPIEITAYNVYRNNTIITSVMGATDTLYVDSDLADGTYEYKITALYGTDESNSSNLLSVVIDTAPPVYNPAQNLTATVVNEMDIELNWDSPEARNISSRALSMFKMEYASQSTRALNGYAIYKNDAMLTSVGTDVLTYTDADLDYGTYAYYVVATYDEAISAPSNTATVVLEDAEEILPPSNLTYSVQEDDVVLNWAVPAIPTEGDGEGFEGTFPSTGWTVDATDTASTWAQEGIVTLTDGDITPSEGVYQAGVRWSYAAQDEWLITPEISGATNLTFDYYGSLGSTHGDNYYVKVSTDGGSTWTAAWNASDSDEGENHYDTPISVDLSSYTGSIKIAWQFVDGDGAGLWFMTFIDNVIITTQAGTTRFAGSDLVAVSKAPKTNKTITTDNRLSKEENSVISSDRNTREMTGYKVYKDDTFLADVAADVLTYTDADLANGTYEYHVTAMYTDGESEASNTVSATVFVTAGEELLSDSFEAYADFSLEFDNWTLVDGDLSPTWGIQDTDFENSGLPMAYIVFNPTATTPALATGYEAVTGDKFLACIASNPAGNDDWVISQSVTLGTTGSVSFYAKSITDQYGLERFNVLVSDGSTNPNDFTSISGATYTEATTEWTQFNYDLAAYASQTVRIAIQCVSDDAFMFMLDDFSLITNGGTAVVDGDAPIFASKLNNNYPNPFNPETTISYSVEEAGTVSIDVYNVLGQKVKTLVNDVRTTGNHSVVWHGENDNNQKVASGVYFYKMRSGKYSKTRKMILMK